MATSITLRAARGYGAASKPYIAALTGTDPRYGFERSFLAGRHYSSRSGSTGGVEAVVTEPGLYESCDVDGKGKDSRYHLVLDLGGDAGLTAIRIKRDTAIELLKSGRAVTEIAPRRDEGGWRIRDEAGKLLWRDAPSDPRAAAIAAIRSLMAEHGLTTADLEG